MAFCSRRLPENVSYSFRDLSTLRIIHCEDGKDHFKATRILSEAAKMQITHELKTGVHNKGLDEREPPFMAPSPDPDDYSNV